MLENSDEDFDFDLDEVVKLNTQPAASHASTQNVSKGVICIYNPNTKENLESVKKSLQGHSQGVSSQETEWGSDDESQFLELPDITSDDLDHKIPTLPSQNSIAIFNKKSINQSTGKILLKNSVDFTKDRNDQNDKHVHKIPEKAKFPGPAGLLTCSSNNQLKGQKPKVNRNLTNMDGLCWWDKALSLLNVKSTWGIHKMNLKMVRKTFSPDVVYLTAPLLIVGVQKMESTPIITNDVDCIFQDPTGEAKGRILKDVFMDYSIQAGTILVLRRPNVLQIGTNCLVTVTKTCLIGMLPSHSDEITKCHDFRREDLISWLAEPVVYGDPVLRSQEATEEKPPVTLFTSAVPAQVAHQSGSYSGSLLGIQSPANNQKPHPSPSTPSNYSRSRAPMNPPTLRPSIRPPNLAGPSRTPNGPVRSPCNSNQFQFKSPSAVVSTPRPAPYPQTNRSVPDSAPKPTIAKEPVNVDDNYLSQFLDGIDTDSLFDDF